MKMTIPLAKKYVASCPISFYLHRKMKIELDPVGSASSYYPYEDRIKISFSQLEKEIEGISDDEADTMIRSNVYHEVSHALLTPKDLLHFYDAEDAQIMNIFEDERIETIAQSVFYNVNFKKSIKHLLRNLKDMPPTEVAYFFLVVRLDKGKQEDVDMKNKIIDSFSKMTRETDDSYALRKYVETVQNFYKECAAHAYSYFEDYRDSFLSREELIRRYQDDGDSDNTSMPEEERRRIVIFVANGFHAVRKPKKPSNDDEDDDEEIIVIVQSDDDDGDGNDNENKEKGEKRENGDSSSNSKNGHRQGYGGPNSKVMFGAMPKKDPSLESRIKMILEKIKIKSRNEPQARYSGVLKPRNLAVRTDWRIFSRKLDSGVKHKLHLTLVVDNSGSYSNSKDITNQLINSLAEVSDENPNFKIDVIKVGDTDELAKSRTEMFIDCSHGTSFGASHRFPEMWKSVQSKDDDFRNMTIVMFDGHCYYSNETLRCLKTIDSKNTVVIYEDDNKNLFESNLTQAKKIYVDSDFSNHLIDESLKALSETLSNL